MAALSIPCGEPGMPAGSAGRWRLAVKALPATALRAADIGARHGYDRRNRQSAGASDGSGQAAGADALPRRVAVQPSEAAPMSLPDARHVSVLGREAVDWLAPRAGGVYVDATFGAGGYSPRNPGRGRHPRDRHRPRPHRDRRRLRSGRAVGRPADAGRRAASPSSPTSARRRACRRSTASCWMSASRRCSSTRPSAASRSGSTGRSTCGWAMTARARPT